MTSLKKQLFKDFYHARPPPPLPNNGKWIGNFGPNFKMVNVQGI